MSWGSVPNVIPGFSSRTFSRCSLAKNMYAERPRLGALGSGQEVSKEPALHMRLEVEVVRWTCLRAFCGSSSRGIVGISGGAQLTLLSPLGLLDLATSLSRGLGHLDGVLSDRVKLATKIKARG